MKNLRLIVIAGLSLALFVPVAVSTAQSGSSADATIAKKKKKQKTGAWCAQQAKKKSRKKGDFKRIAKINAQRAFLYLNKNRTTHFFCSESPKFAGTLGTSGKIETTIGFQAVKKQCAILYSQTTPGSNPFSGRKEVTDISYSRTGGKYSGWVGLQTLGDAEDAIELHALKLSKNCVWAAGYMDNGKPTIGFAGTGNYPVHAFLVRDAPGATAEDLKTVDIKVISRTKVQITWTQAGQLKTIDY